MGTYDGTAVGAPGYGAVKFANGIVGGGVNDAVYINLPTSPLNFGASSSWTVEAWVKTSAAATEVWMSGGATTNAIFWGMSSAGKARIGGAAIAGYPGGQIDSVGTINNGALHHVRCTCQTGTTIKIFIDGVLDSTAVGTFAAPTGVANIGKYVASNGFAWTGAIDEIAVFSTYNASNFTPPASAYTGSEAGLVALYHLDSNATDSAAVVSVVAATPVIGEYGPTTVALSWAAATGGTAPYTYQVQRAPDSAGSPGTFANDGASQAGLTFLDTGRTASTKYWYRVIATDSGVPTSGTSSNVTITTLATGLKYNRLDGVDPVGGQAVMMLIPNASAAIPYNAANPTPLIMHFHSRGSDHTQLVTDVNAPVSVAAWMDAGYLIVASNGHGNNWGSQQACVDNAAAYRFAVDTYNVSKVLLLATSMGGAAALNCLSQQVIPSVVAFYGIYPVCSLSAMRSSGANVATYLPEINSVFAVVGAVTWGDASAGMDPGTRWGSAFRGAYMRFVCSDADTVVIDTTNAVAQAAIVLSSSPEAGVLKHTGDHGDATAWQSADSTAFFARALAGSVPTSGRIGSGGAPFVEG